MKMNTCSEMSEMSKARDEQIHKKAVIRRIPPNDSLFRQLTVVIINLPDRSFLCLSDCAGRTYALASAAINASSLINHILGLTLRDCTDRTFTNTASAAYASITNSTCHNNSSLNQ